MQHSHCSFTHSRFGLFWLGAYATRMHVEQKRERERAKQNEIKKEYRAKATACMRVRFCVRESGRVRQKTEKNDTTQRE